MKEREWGEQVSKESERKDGREITKRLREGLRECRRGKRKRGRERRKRGQVDIEGEK